MKAITLSWGAAASLALCLTSPAEAQVTLEPTAIVSWSSGKCVNVEGASRVNLARLIQWPCDSSAHSAFTLEPYGDAYRIIASHSSKCLSVEGSSSLRGAGVIQSDCVGAANELWKLELDPTKKVYRLRAKHSDKCLNVAGNQLASGTSLVQSDCGGDPNELWSFGGGFVAANQYVHLLTDTRQCIEVSGGALGQNAAVMPRTCKRAPGDNDQSFALKRSGDAYLVLAQHSGKCLGVAAASAADGAPVVQSTCVDGNHQLWQLERYNTGFRFFNKHSGHCLDAASSSSLVQRACTRGPKGLPSQAFEVSVASKLGAWSDVIDLPLVPVAAALLKNGRVMIWSSYDEFANDIQNEHGYTKTVQFHPGTNRPVTTHSETVITGHDMFCPGTALLPDGKLLVNGGSSVGGTSSRKTTIYDVDSKTWSAAAAMTVGRGYASAAVLDTGEVFTIGGSWPSRSQGNKNGEVFNLIGGWRPLAKALVAPMTGPDPKGPYRGDNHAWLFNVGGGRVFHAGPSASMNWYGTAGAGSVDPAGNRGDDSYSINGNASMYDVGLILKVGGAPAYQDANATGTSYVIDIDSGVAVRKTGSLTYPRAFHTSVVLPDGRVLVVGGQAHPIPFTDSQAPLTSEIWNPATDRFVVGASMTVPRTYHSVALLLPDGRVLAGGGGLDGPTCDCNHANVELYSPDYLFAPNGQPALRPLITSAPVSMGYNTTARVTTSVPVARFSLVRLSSVTHAVNNDQRRVPLAIASSNGNSYTLATPANAGVATPGYYMLFALDAAGVPSVAAIIRVQ